MQFLIEGVLGRVCHLAHISATQAFIICGVPHFGNCKRSIVNNCKVFNFDYFEMKGFDVFKVNGFRESNSVTC